MKLNIKNICANKKKLTYISLIALLLIIISSLVIFNITDDSKKNNEDIAASNLVEDNEKEEEIAAPENEEVVLEESKEKEETTPVENNDKAIKDNNTQAANEKAVVKQPEKKPENNNVQVKKEQQNNKPVTYTSKNLGITFTMPTVWRDNYYVKEAGDEVRFFMKHEGNNEGRGFLFVVTSDVNKYDHGNHLDRILTEGKFITVNNKQYLVGGPLDCSIEPSDPKCSLFRTMTQQCAGVIKSMR